jgi:nicotinate-nucleotide--dimethylbenzimidazole phosphoribosyltransferase
VRMEELRRTLREVIPLEDEFIRKAQNKLDNLTKPLGSLGKLESIAIQYSAITESLNPAVRRKVIFTCAGDHGVVAKGVSAYPREVTIQMVLNMLAGGAAVNVLARHVGAEVVVVDVGVAHDFDAAEGLLIRKVGYGTDDMTEGPAMSYDDAIRAIKVGIGLVDEYAGRGVDIIGTGEMGIGNTTPSSAILSILADISPGDATGRGTGIDDDTIDSKIKTIARAIAHNRPDHDDPIDVLAKVGGYEIGAIAGIIIGGAARRIPVVVDGFISTAGALIATKLNPTINEYLFYSHLSAEAGHRKMLAALGQRPIMDLDMRLGEGTGAAIAMSVIEAAVKVMNEMATFESAEVDRMTE